MNLSHITMAELSRLNYRITLLLAKYVPEIIAILYLIMLILSCFGINLVLLSSIASLSLLPAICLISFSILFKFCIWHRLPIYYVLFQNLINEIDFYFGIPVTSLWMLFIYLLITGMFILIGAWLKNKYNGQKRIIEK